MYQWIHIEQSVLVLFRKLTSEDWRWYRDIRLRSLEEVPQAFESSLIEESNFDETVWRQRLESTASSFCLGAFIETGELVAVAGFAQGHKLKTQHKSYLWGVYVLPNARGFGIASGLMKSIIKEFDALKTVSSLQLTVTANNTQAIDLYKKFGFKEYGLEKDALRVTGISYDELLMHLVKPLN